MKNKKHYKPGTRKTLSPRIGNMSNRWLRLVLQRAAVEISKDARKEVYALWLAGYSHKDAAAKVQGAPA